MAPKYIHDDNRSARPCVPSFFVRYSLQSVARRFAFFWASVLAGLVFVWMLMGTCIVEDCCDACARRSEPAQRRRAEGSTIAGRAARSTGRLASASLLSALCRLCDLSCVVTVLQLFACARDFVARAMYLVQVGETGEADLDKSGKAILNFSQYVNNRIIHSTE